MKKQLFYLSQKSLFLLFVALLSITVASAQQQQVKGRVTSAKDNTPLIGVTVLVEGTQAGTTTDGDGSYTITASKSGSLEFSYIGYETISVEIAGKNSVDVAMKEDNEVIEEVVVIGYGALRKREITGAVSSVKSEDLNRVGGASFASALQGQVAGVNVQASSGAPGAAANVQIRGIGSLSSGSLGPLYVVDGMPTEGNPNIPASEIKSLEVLKDAASASIYGTRAANGVIIITTKKGEAGKLKVNLDAYYGIQKITSGIDLLDVRGMLIVNDLSTKLNGGEGETTYNPLEMTPDGLFNNTDWMKIVTNDLAPVQSYDLSISGGKDGLTHNMMMSYFNQEGVMAKGAYERLSLRSNTNYKNGKFSAMSSVSVSYDKKENTPYGMHDQAIAATPLAAPRSLDSDVEFSDDYESQGVDQFTRLLKETNYSTSNGFNVNLNLSYELVEGLKLNANIGGNMSQGYGKYFEPSYMVYTSDGNPTAGSNPIAKLTETFSTGSKISGETNLTYNKWFEGGHTINAVFGFSAEKGRWDSRRNMKQGFLNNDINTPDAGSDGDKVTGSNSTNTIVGMIGRVMYNYQDRYLFSISARRDGSSRFGESKWATFPAASAGWNLSEEPFYKKGSIKNVMNSFKLRASWGTAGNQSIPNYSYEGMVYNNLDYVLGKGDQSNILGGVSQRGFANPAVQWETSVSRNVGLDVGFMDDALTLVVDLYKTNKKDMLLPVSLAPSAGVPTDNWEFKDIRLNAGDMTNSGVEVALSYKGVVNDFSYRVSGTFTKNVNMVTKTYVPSNYISGGNPTIGRASENTTYIKEGYPAGSFFLIPNRGTIKTEEQLEEYREIVGSAKLGDLWIEDTNGDGTLNDDDRVFCGSGTPDFEAGLAINLGYKNFDFNMQLYGTYGNMVYNGSKLFAYKVGRHQDLLYCWSPYNPTSNIPSVRREMEHNNKRSINDYYLEDGSYLRLRNVQLGYTLPKKVVNALSISSVRFYISAENPLTFTKYTGYDPEIGGDGLLTKGVDCGSYPVSAQYRCGIQIGF